MAGLPSRSLALRQLIARLFAVPDIVVSAEGDLFTVRQQDYLAALHDILLVERPGIEEILERDHENMVRDFG